MSTDKPTPGNAPDDMTAFPGAGDKLFDIAVGRPAAAPSFSKKQDWYFYINGYKDAADFLMDHGGTEVDFRKVGYQILFLYRQHLELVLKDLIRDCRSLLGWDEAFPKTHRIDELWRLCLNLLQEISPGMCDNEEMQHTTRLMAEFCKVDPTSEAFRYPENRDGNPPRFDVDIDLSRVKDVVGKISLLVDCISTHISTLENDAF